MKKNAMLLAVVLILGMTLASCTGQSAHMAYVGEGFTMENAEGKTLTCENGQLTGDMKTGSSSQIDISEDAKERSAAFSTPPSDTYHVQFQGLSNEMAIQFGKGKVPPYLVQGKGVKEMTLERNTSLSATGEEMVLSIAMPAPENLGSGVMLCQGFANGQATMTLTETGFRMEGMNVLQIMVELVGQGVLTYPMGSWGEQPVTFELDLTNFAEGKATLTIGYLEKEITFDPVFAGS